MSYSINPVRPLREEIVRIASAQLQRAVGDLRSTGNGAHRAVHEARKRFKKLRGLYRLVRSGAPDFCQAENARLRDVAKTLSAERDATALVETAQKLRCRFTDPEDADFLAKLEVTLSERRDAVVRRETDLPVKMNHAADCCLDAMAALEWLELPRKPAKATAILVKGFGKTYDTARTTYRAARDSGHSEEWHELRRYVKYHWMHLRLMRGLWPGVMKLRAAGAELMGEDLGDDHDLAILQDVARDEPAIIDWPDGMAHLVRLTDIRCAELRADASEAAGFLFAEDGEAMRERTAMLWRDAVSRA